MKLTPRFRKWWDSQIERCKDEQGTSRKKKDSNQDATLAEAIGTGRKEVSVPWFSLVLIVNACMYNVHCTCVHVVNVVNVVNAWHDVVVAEYFIDDASPRLNVKCRLRLTARPYPSLLLQSYVLIHISIKLINPLFVSFIRTPYSSLVSNTLPRSFIKNSQ